MFVEHFCLLLVCGDSVVVVFKDGVMCGVDVTVFVIENVYEFE